MFQSNLGKCLTAKTSTLETRHALTILAFFFRSLFPLITLAENYTWQLHEGQLSGTSRGGFVPAIYI